QDGHQEGRRLIVGQFASRDARHEEADFVATERASIALLEDDVDRPHAAGSIADRDRDLRDATLNRRSAFSQKIYIGDEPTFTSLHTSAAAPRCSGATVNGGSARVGQGEFARAGKAAARAVALYPAAHPAIATTLARLMDLTSAANGSSALKITVLPTSLLLGGRSPVRVDAAVGELAALLHEHLVGELTIHPGGDIEAW